MRLSTKQLLRRIPFHRCVEQARDILMAMSDNRMFIPLSDGLGALVRHLKQIFPSVNHKRLHAANEL